MDETNWMGIWITRTKGIAFVIHDSNGIVGYTRTAPRKYRFYEANGIYQVDANYDLMERLREGSKEYEELVREFEEVKMYHNYGKNED